MVMTAAAAADDDDDVDDDDDDDHGDTPCEDRSGQDFKCMDTIILDMGACCRQKCISCRAGWKRFQNLNTAIPLSATRIP